MTGEERGGEREARDPKKGEGTPFGIDDCKHKGRPKMDLPSLSIHPSRSTSFSPSPFFLPPP